MDLLEEKCRADGLCATRVSVPVSSTAIRSPLVYDDVFAELDGGRSERILELMEGEDTGQVVLTAPKDADVRIRRDALPRWRIQAGEITT